MEVEPSLPDDLLLEILVHVKDEAALFRSATVCKRWLRLITDRWFLRRRWPQYSPSSFVGFFTRGNRHGEPDEGSLPGPEPCFIPARRSALGPCRRSLGSFVTSAHAGLFNGALPLISRHGLVVVCLEAHDSTGYPDRTIFQLGVCNLHAATCVMLPPLKVSPNFYCYDCNGYAILTGVDFCSKDELTPTLQPSNPLSFFKVIIIGYTGDDLKYNLHTFSSDKSSWDERTNCFDGDAQSYDYGSFSDAIVHNGLAHWIFHSYGEGCLQVTNLNAKTGHISLTNLPLKLNYQPTKPSCLTLGINGVLSLLWMQKEGPQLDIWEQREDQGNMRGTSEWLCTRTIELRQPVKNNEIRELLVLREKCGALLITDNYGQVYATDLETGMMEKIVDWPSRRSICHWDSMLLEIDWPTIFISGLTK
ncbi:hypothetical protein CFC21_038717 [Triticum aestivum]|uniref:F-box domain-containing protein n=2 Tax=Triticum aestivum TaxID=4565 RepID=A0A9R1FDD5_WHEAT|nr:hypothetical protein CFC21_038717 [Triticum aestivum]